MKHDIEAAVDVSVIRHDENINLKESSEERLVFRKFPISLWVVGSIVTLAGIYLVYHLALGHIGATPFEELEG